MPIIKNTSSTRLLKDAVVLDLGDLDRQARRLTDDARAEAARILESAKREAQKLIDSAAAIGQQQGFQQGLEEGHTQGREEGHQAILAELKPRFETIASQWEEAIRHWNHDRDEMLLEAKQDVLALALELGHKVVFRILDVDPSVVEDQLAESLSLLAGASSAVVRIHPEDRPLVAQVLPAILEKLNPETAMETNPLRHVSIREEPEMTRGGCIVNTERGEIDARIETQLCRIVDALLPSPQSMGLIEETTETDS